MNPMEFLRGIKNPQQFVMNMLVQNQTPMGMQLINLVKTGNKTQIENFARNKCKEKRHRLRQTICGIYETNK